MPEERRLCTTLKIAGPTVLVIGGSGSNQVVPRSTELLTQLGGEGGGGEGEKWQWRLFSSMSGEHGGDPLAVLISNGETA
ncbi:unnamed protein product [Hymenolepis diminuta]|uniref:LSDAT_euk domain-containing protein n=1 Tax=Hymenolepis diminuta TaxID=6216 RepID=A0A0R3STL1_HYMDI|nr:unnamed protein product [Hymenolepis diminuta]